MTSFSAPGSLLDHSLKTLLHLHAVKEAGLSVIGC